MTLSILRALSYFSCLFILLCCKGDHPHFSGYVEGETIYLASPFYGVLEKLAVHRGQKVKKGELLCVLDPNPQQLHIAEVEEQLEQAKSILEDMKKPKRVSEIAAIEAQIKQTEAQIELAQIRVTRYKQLFAKQATDKDSLDAAIANLQQQQELKQQYESNLALAHLGSRQDQLAAQQNQIDSLLASLKVAQWELAQKTLVAPADGTIFDEYYRPGEFVAAQKPIVSLLTPKNIHIEFFVPLDYLSRLKMGQPIFFDCEGCKPHNEAIISYLAPEAEYLPPLVYSRDNRSNLVFRVLADMKNAEMFKPGQPVTVILE